MNWTKELIKQAYDKQKESILNLLNSEDWSDYTDVNVNGQAVKMTEGDVVNGNYEHAFIYARGTAHAIYNINTKTINRLKYLETIPANIIERIKMILGRKIITIWKDRYIKL